MRGEFDAVVACYHDQGLIPVKLVAFGQAVNVTLGLPIVRTSVDHGTAFDIAGQGVADPSSLIEAVRLAARLARGAAGMTGRSHGSTRTARIVLAWRLALFYAVLGLLGARLRRLSTPAISA